VRLVEAWALVQDRGAASEMGTAQLVLAGWEDPRYPQARQRVQELGLQNSVIFVGEVADADLPALYSGAASFVFPSLCEGFGLPVLEAMACGASVACSNTSSLPEIVGAAALTFDPTSVSEIATSLQLLLKNPGLRQALSERSLEQAARFSWQATAGATHEVYRKVLEHG